jgi:DNA-binding NarL/FixJ family response regulator
MADHDEAPQVIVVVLAPTGAYRTTSDVRRVAQVYQLPFAHADRPGDGSRPAHARAGERPAANLSPVADEILAQVVRALEQSTAPGQRRETSPRSPLGERSANLPSLTPREREVLRLVLDGRQNKNIANELQVSMRTVEVHRASIMRKTGSKSLPALVRLAIATGAVNRGGV